MVSDRKSPSRSEKFEGQEIGNQKLPNSLQSKVDHFQYLTRTFISATEIGSASAIMRPRAIITKRQKSRRLATNFVPSPFSLKHEQLDAPPTSCQTW